MKLTIIIPVYNSEKYLTECLASVFQQNLLASEYEVIVINDGSTDESKNIILDFQNTYSNLVFIDQDNQGVSAARNAGLQLSRGEYITFIDADDEIFKNSLKRIIEYAKEKDLDLLYPKIDYINADGEITGEFKMDSDSEEILDGFSHQRRGYIFAFYKKELISNIRFNQKIPIAEDSLFNIEVHAIAKRCGYKNWSYYQYRKGILSSSNSNFPQTEKAFNGYIEFLGCVKTLMKNNKEIFSAKQIKYYDRPFYVTIEMMTNVNIIPTISVSRLRRLKKELKILDIEYIADTVEQTIPYFKSHWLLFFAYHSPKVIEYKIKTFIYQKLLQLKIIKK